LDGCSFDLTLKGEARAKMFSRDKDYFTAQRYKLRQKDCFLLLFCPVDQGQCILVFFPFEIGQF
jgi:hypothetical protein